MYYKHSIDIISIKVLILDNISINYKPNLLLILDTKGYGLTETAGGIFLTKGPEEAKPWGSTGRLSGSFEAKIVDPETGEALPPCKEGELWVKGPSVMKGVFIYILQEVI